jgi:metal-responsive CopG/Arc/MetJ family transcriptional regulator
MASKTLNIALDDTLIKRIDKAVKKDLGSRSEYFRRLALADLDRRQRWDELFAAGNKLGKEMGITSEEQVYEMIADYKREKQQKRDQQQTA